MLYVFCVQQGEEIAHIIIKKTLFRSQIQRQNVFDLHCHQGRNRQQHT